MRPLTLRWSLSSFASSLSLILLLPAAIAADSRTWKDSTGEFELVAELVAVKDGTVKLKKKDGSVVDVKIARLSSEDRQFLSQRNNESSAAGSQDVSAKQLSGKTSEVSNDDGRAAGKKSFPRGIAARFETESSDRYLTSIKIHGARYGTAAPPREDFTVTLCDKDFGTLTEFKFPYSKFARGNSKWVTLRVKPTKLPKDFVLCLNFNPTGTKGVYVSHDADGRSLVGLPDKPQGAFTGGDWMVRAVTDTTK